MELIITFLESSLLSALVSAVVSGFIAVRGILIHLVMERLYPDKMSLHQINSAEKPTLQELAAKIHELDVELNIHRAFIPASLVSVFEELIKVADQFFVCAETHFECWDEAKEDREKKENLRLIAYEQRLTFYKKWKSSNAKCREHLESKELV